jgi:tetratricopeptide (TPR) repeat protein
MTTPNTLKWTVTLLLAAACTFAGGPRTSAQTPESASTGPGTVVSDVPPEPQEKPFDESITVPELFEKAREAFGLDNYDLAEKFYQEILIRERSNVRAMLELSNVYERSGKLEYARGLLARSAKLDPGNQTIAKRLDAVERTLTIVLTDEVDSLIASRQYELAIPKLSVLLSIDPNNSEVYYKRALCYARLGRPEGALSSIDKALQIDQQEKYYKLRTAILEDLKELETREMVAEAKKLIASDEPENHARALDVLAEILESNPEHAWAKTEFVRLSTLTEADETGDPESDLEGGLPDLRAIAAFLVKAGVTAAELVQRHLSAALLLVIVLLVFRSPFTKRLTQIFAPRAFLSGRFPRFTLTEILVMLNSESHTGVLHVKGESCRGKIYFEHGEPCHCSVGKIDGVGALNHLLSNSRIGRFEFADGSIPLNRSIDTPLSVILVEHSGGGPGRRRRLKDKSKKSKSKMKELLETKSGR